METLIKNLGAFTEKEMGFGLRTNGYTLFGSHMWDSLSSDAKDDLEMAAHAAQLDVNCKNQIRSRDTPIYVWALKKYWDELPASDQAAWNKRAIELYSTKFVYKNTTTVR